MGLELIFTGRDFRVCPNSIVIVILSKVLFLDQALLQFFDVIEEEVDIFLILFPPIVVVGVLSIISGLGYASCLKNFKE